MNRENEKRIESLPGAVRVSYLAWLGGADLREALSRPSFYRYRRLIINEIGVDIKNSPPEDSNNITGKPLTEKDSGWDPEPVTEPIYPSAELKTAYQSGK